MSVNFDVPTRVSMFVRLQDNQEQAWNDFVQQYGPMIAAWCLRHSLGESEAADVTQTVLLKLIEVMRKSKYDPNKGSFRSWLKTVTNNAVRDMMRSRNRPGSHPTARHLLHNLEDPQALDDLNQCVDAECRQMMLREAERRVRARVRDFTWQAFELTAVQQRSPSEVAKLLDMRVAEVYVAKSRVIKMLNEEVLRQEAEEA
jgi:RNA polymerase sigma-70 factor (ECF subfamily)